MKVKFETEIEITNQDIDDIVCTALEGGINYWCGRCEVVGDYLGEYASDQISRGGSLILYDFEDGGEYVLTPDNFMNGITKYLKEFNGRNEYCVNIIDHNQIDTCCVDAIVADVIIQLALFDNVIYG